MNLTDRIFNRSELPENSLSMGGALGLWDIAANKIARFPLYVIFLKQAADRDLQNSLSSTISSIQRQITAIQKLFKEKGFKHPMAADLDKKLKDKSPFVISGLILNDEEISNAEKGIIRGILGLETEALRNATIPEERDLIYDMLKVDNDLYISLLNLQKKKNWIVMPPDVLPN